MEKVKNIDKFKFNPVRGFADVSAFPNPKDEEQTREQMQRMHNQTRDYINDFITLLQSNNAAASIGVKQGMSLQSFLDSYYLLDYSQLAFDTNQIVQDAILAYFTEDNVLCLDGMDAYIIDNVLSLDNVNFNDGILSLGE